MCNYTSNSSAATANSSSNSDADSIKAPAPIRLLAPRGTPSFHECRGRNHQDGELINETFVHDVRLYGKALTPHVRSYGSNRTNVTDSCCSVALPTVLRAPKVQSVAAWLVSWVDNPFCRVTFRRSGASGIPSS